MLTRTRWLLLSGSVLVALLALFFPHRDAPRKATPLVRGRNKTVLFLINKEHGLSNVHIATASSLLENHADVDVHFASYPAVRQKLERVSEFARRKTPEARDIVFHELSSASYEDAVVGEGKTMTNLVHPPGAAGISHFLKDLQLWISPWSVEDHIAIYEELNAIIDDVDPAVIVLDTLFRPGLDATRDKNRLHALITPQTLVDSFLDWQPFGRMFWKYPALASGFAYPVPWRQIPENIYLNLRFIYSVVMTPDLAAKRKELREKGFHDPINFFTIYREDVPWITMTTEGASVPVDVVPPNVTCAGPIVLSSAPAVEQDPDLVEWLKRKPTVLVNLGSTVIWTETQATTMADAIAQVVSKANVQVLWKFKKLGDYSDDFLKPLQPYLDNGSVKMQQWLTVDPTSLLESGYITASVHHGGSNCYHEAVSAGVPHVILPQWADLYNYAALVETIGIGTWGCRNTSPGWTVDDLRDSILKVVDGGKDIISIREKAKELGKQVEQRGKGRDIAARVIAELAYSGDQ